MLFPKRHLCLALVVLGTLSASAQSFKALWKEYDAAVDAGKPQTAYAVARRIWQKADKEGSTTEGLCARLLGMEQHKEWAADSFFVDIQDMERLREEAKEPAAKAVYASLLAEAYEGNRSRSQATHLEITSTDMREWSREQYDSAATSNWGLSLQDPEALAQTRSKTWLPLVVQDETSEYYKHDLLHLLWQRCRKMAYYGGVRAAYAKRHNDNALLLLALDSIEQCAGSTEALERLRVQYASLPLCAEVYLRLIQQSNDDSLTVALAEEAISRYPRYARIQALRNALLQAQQPHISWQESRRLYPAKTYRTPIQAKNATALDVTMLELPDTFTEEALLASEENAITYLRRVGREVATFHHSLPSAPAYKEVDDTVEWTSGAPGIYALLLTPSTKDKTYKKSSTPTEYYLYRTSRLETFWQLAGQECVLTVVDGMSGHPEEGVTVNVFSSKRSEKTLFYTAETDERGCIRFQRDEARGTTYHLTLAQGEDVFHETFQIHNTLLADGSSMEANEELRLYTDRALYRPGQTIHVGGVAYTQQHWDAEVVRDKEYTLTLYTQGEELARQTVRTDSMGTLAADFVIPTSKLPGRYSISAAGTSIGVEVEEYKRPTFEVTMDEAPALQWPQDSLRLTGRAMNFSGSPVRQGRVVVKHKFRRRIFYWQQTDIALPETTQPDTLQTDDEGRFEVAMTLGGLSEEALRWGIYLHADVEVLSAGGETQTTSSQVELCSTPLRATIEMNRQQERDHLSPISVTLLSSTGKATDGEVAWNITPAGTKETVLDGRLVSNKTQFAFPLDTLKRLKSGRYELHIHATAAADTAQAHHTFCLFGLDDTEMVMDEDIWLYCPDKAFDAEHPAQVQVGTALDDVSLYYSVISGNGDDTEPGMMTQEILSLSHEVRTLEVPYLSRYGDGAKVTIAFVKDGRFYTKTVCLTLRQPAYDLKWQWMSFRNRLHPGDKETWTLRLTHPDGTAASAQLMATLYDASLDAICQRSAWKMTVWREHAIASTLIYHSRNYKSTAQMYFGIPYASCPSIGYDHFDERYLMGLQFGWGGRFLSFASGTRRMAKAMVTDDAVFCVEEAPLANESNMVAEAVATESNGVVAGLALADETQEGQGGRTATSTVRSNFDETAFFLPRLHTDAQGEVSLSFTLPESLTSWRFMGVAHTADMHTTALEDEVVAQKEMMAHLHLPRFLRVGDEATLRATIENLGTKAQEGKARFEILDAETEKVITQATQPFAVTPSAEAVVTFGYTPTEEFPVVIVRLTATTSDFSDGEQYYLPILSSKEWVTETVEINADGQGRHTTDLSALFNNNSQTATERRLTVEYTACPIWTAIQSLPSIKMPERDDVLSLTTALYANALASHIVQQIPQLGTLMEQWRKEEQEGGTALCSRLEQDEDLWQVLASETPWIIEARDDSQRRHQLVELLDDEGMAYRLTAISRRLEALQQKDGGFAWFEGMASSRYMTSRVALELSRLKVLAGEHFGITDDNVAQNMRYMLDQAIGFLATEMSATVKEMKEMEARGTTIRTSYDHFLNYLYIVHQAAFQPTKAQQADIDYLLQHLKGTVRSMDNDQRALAAIVLQQHNSPKEAQTYLTSLKEHTTTTPQRGTFFDTPSGSFSSIDEKIHHHTLAMEALTLVAPADTVTLRGMQRWLLQQKRTQMWERPIETVDAIYALLVGERLEVAEHAGDRLTLSFANGKKKSLDSKDGTAGLGYVRQTWEPSSQPKVLTVQRQARGQAWGAVYAQYLTSTTEVTAQHNGLQLRREVSATHPALGDKMTTRYVITADRDYEYVCLSASHAACAESAGQVSGIRYQGGLFYYIAHHDTRTDYFIESLPKGTYLLEETSHIDRSGQYQTGTATLQCLYAPEYHATTTNITLQVSE